jgi:fatty-acyl-CoA synthase
VSAWAISTNSRPEWTPPHALAPFDGVTVDAVIEDGTVIAAVTLSSEVDEPKVAATLARYTVPTRLTSRGNS